LKKTIALITMIFAATTAIADNTIATRFGPMKAGEFGAVSYKGKEVTAGNNSLVLIKKVQIGDADVFLFQDNGGNWCSTLYRFVTVTASGAKVSEDFGTCNGQTNVSQDGENVRVDIPGCKYVAGGSCAAGSEKTKCSFIYKAGVVTQSNKTAGKLCVALSP
jgi:hypothetical protein